MLVANLSLFAVEQALELVQHGILVLLLCSDKIFELGVQLVDSGVLRGHPCGQIGRLTPGRDGGLCGEPGPLKQGNLLVLVDIEVDGAETMLCTRKSQLRFQGARERERGWYGDAPDVLAHDDAESFSRRDGSHELQSLDRFFALGIRWRWVLLE